MSRHPEKKPRRLPRALFWLVVLLVLGAAAAPTVVFNSPLLASFLSRAIPAEAGSLTASGGAGGWLSPVSLSGIELRDARGNLVLQTEELVTSHTLPSLLSRSQPLKLQIKHPTVYLNVRPDGTNVEDLIAAIERNKTPAASGDEQPTDLGGDISAISIQNAVVYVTEAATGTQWTHQGINVELDLNGGLSKLVANGRLGASLGQFEPLAQGEPVANFRVELQPNHGAARRVELMASGAPIDALTPLAHRVDPTARLTGLVSGQGKVVWNAPQTAGDWVDLLLASGLVTEGSLTVSQFAAQAQAFGGDTLRLTSLQVPWNARVEGDSLVLQDLRIDSEVGTARARGVLPAEALRQFANGVAPTVGGRWPSGRVGADLDVARLAQIAPGAVALRDDVRPVAGRVVIDLNNEDPSRERLQGKLTAADFRGEVAGKPIAWDQPLTIDATVLHRPAGPVIESLRCQSEFLTGDLQGDLANLRGNLAFDLDKLATQLGQFVDLRSWRLTGQGNAELRTEQTAPNARQLSLVASMAEVVVARGSAVYLQEPQLDASVSALAIIDPQSGKPVQLQSAHAGLRSGADNLIADLAKPLPLTGQSATALKVELHGALESWQNRLRVALAPLGLSELLARYRASGQIDLRADVRLGGGLWRFTGVEANATSLAIDGGGLSLREPEARLSGDFAWDAARGMLESKQGVAQSSTVSLRSEGVLASAGSATGRVAMRADLSKLNQWFVATNRPMPQGEVQGTLNLSQQQGRLHASFVGEGKQIAFLDAATKQPLLSDPHPQAVAEVTYLTEGGQLLVDSATITSSTLRVQASGGVQNGATQFAGTADYDLTAWAPVIAGYLGPEVRVTGKHQGRFSLTRAANTAPDVPWSHAWRGRIEAPWTSVNLFSLPIGAGTLGATLENGEVRLDPLNLQVSGGSLTTQLGVRFDPPPTVWGVSPGPLLTDVAITPEISNRMLKYIAPVLAGATRCQGLFSMRLESASGPISPLRQLTAKGQLDAKSVLVTPGPTTVQLVGLAKQVEALIKNGDPTALLGATAANTTLLSINQRTVNFEVKNGRVFHSGLQFEVGDVTFVTDGSVGLDETLDIVLSVPIKDNWIAGKPAWQGLRGKVVRFPIRGTLGRPNPDEREFRNLSKSLVREGVRGLLGGALQDLLGN